MMNGQVVRVMSDKGFGFIKGEDGREYFFHRSALQMDWYSLREGQQVSFEIGNGAKGPRAEDVVPQ